MVGKRQNLLASLTQHEAIFKNGIDSAAESEPGSEGCPTGSKQNGPSIGQSRGCYPELQNGRETPLPTSHLQKRYATAYG